MPLSIVTEENNFIMMTFINISSLDLLVLKLYPAFHQPR